MREEQSTNAITKGFLRIFVWYLPHGVGLERQRGRRGWAGLATVFASLFRCRRDSRLLTLCAVSVTTSTSTLKVDSFLEPGRRAVDNACLLSFLS